MQDNFIIVCTDVVLSEILKGKFYDTNKKQGLNHKYFDYLSDELSKCEHISNIGGVGAMFAFQVFDGTPDVTMKVVHKLFENGVISFIAGKSNEGSFSFSDTRNKQKRFKSSY